MTFFKKYGINNGHVEGVKNSKSVLFDNTQRAAVPISYGNEIARGKAAMRRAPKTIATGAEALFETPRLSVVEVRFLRNGREIRYTMGVTPVTSVAVLPWRQSDRGPEVLLLRQAWPIGGLLPSMVVCVVRKGECPSRAALRELREEAGIPRRAVIRLQRLGKVVHHSTRLLAAMPEAGKPLQPKCEHLYLAEINPTSELVAPKHEPEEEIEIIGWIPLEEAIEEVTGWDRMTPNLLLLLLALESKTRAAAP